MTLSVPLKEFSQGSSRNFSQGISVISHSEHQLWQSPVINPTWVVTIERHSAPHSPLWAFSLGAKCILAMKQVNPFKKILKIVKIWRHFTHKYSITIILVHPGGIQKFQERKGFPLNLETGRHRNSSVHFVLLEIIFVWVLSAGSTRVCGEEKRKATWVCPSDCQSHCTFLNLWLLPSPPADLALLSPIQWKWLRHKLLLLPLSCANLSDAKDSNSSGPEPSFPRVFGEHLMYCRASWKTCLPFSLHRVFVVHVFVVSRSSMVTIACNIAASSFPWQNHFPPRHRIKYLKHGPCTRL